jgi:hypothetical protein
MLIGAIAIAVIPVDLHRPLHVMAGLVPAIHALLSSQGVDARHKAGHDEG